MPSQKSPQKSERGKYVLRSTYQKVVEENKKLLADIGLLVSEEYPLQKIELIAYWQDKFKKDRQLSATINMVLKNLLQEQRKQKL
jgi:hypothetical protein